MDLNPYVVALHQELMAAAEPGESTALAERLAASVVSATRLTMLDVLSAAADEISRDLVPGSVELRLRGRDPQFVVTMPVESGQFGDDDADEPAVMTTPDPLPPENGEKQGAAARINFRPPEQLKQRIEAAAAAEGLSVNAWLIRLTSAALSGDPGRRPTPETKRVKHFRGWVG